MQSKHKQKSSELSQTKIFQIIAYRMGITMLNQKLLKGRSQNRHLIPMFIETPCKKIQQLTLSYFKNSINFLSGLFWVWENGELS